MPQLDHLWEAREVLFRFAARDVTLRYRQTALGVVWVVLQPLLAAGVLSFVFGNVAHLSSNGVPPLLFTFAGLLVFNLVNTILTRGTNSLVQNAQLVSKVFFPRMLVPLATAGSAMLDFCVSLAFLGVLLAVHGVHPGPAVAFVPAWLLLTVCLASGIALVTSALMVSYRDVQYVVPFLLQVALYASPVAYAVGKVPANYRIFYDVNPLTWLLADMRWSVLHQHRPSLTILVLSVVVPLAVLVAGALVFEHRERGFADVI